MKWDIFSIEVFDHGPAGLVHQFLSQTETSVGSLHSLEDTDIGFVFCPRNIQINVLHNKFFLQAHQGCDVSMWYIIWILLPKWEVTIFWENTTPHLLKWGQVKSVSQILTSSPAHIPQFCHFRPLRCMRAETMKADNECHINKQVQWFEHGRHFKLRLTWGQDSPW